jgi:SagB-type dehydrogenase family enzyme
MLDRACTGMSADFPGGAGATLNQLYLIVNEVDGLPAGSYVFHRGPSALEQLREGDFRDRAGYLDLGQELAADAGVNVYFLADLHAALERYGNRGYRISQLEAAIMGGRLYLGAYAQGLGATGLTFFDDEVTEFFSPHAQGKSVMFLVALGKPASRRRRA